jgi:copper chaperone CopZ
MVMDISSIGGTTRGVVGGLISSACCLGSLLLLLIGIGNFSLAASMGAYRNYFILAGIAFVLLSIANHLRRKAKQCACSYKQLLRSESKFITTTLLAFTTIFGVINLAIIPYVTATISEGTDVSANVNSASELRELRLKVDGMTCESCAEAIRASLLQTEGVMEAEVSYAKGVAVVIYNPSLVSPQEIMAKVPKPYVVTILSDNGIQIREVEK